jgi:hypothetical protein
MPLCNSPTVSSSSSNAGGGGTADETLTPEASLAVAVTLMLANPTPLITLLRTKVLRFIVFLE